MEFIVSLPSGSKIELTSWQKAKVREIVFEEPKVERKEVVVPNHKKRGGWTFNLWTPEQDMALRMFLNRSREGTIKRYEWKEVAGQIGRHWKSCQNRYYQLYRDRIKRGETV